MSTDGLGTSWRTMLPGGSPASTVASDVSSANQGDRAKVVELAREFEAFFVSKMIRQMREAMLDDQEHDGLGAGTMTETMDVELARQISQAGGIGLAKVLGEAIDRQVLGTRGGVGTTPAGSQEPTGAVSPATVTSAAGGVQAVVSAAVPLPLTAPISSAYGFRTDPLDGTRRFHTGIDIAAAYGREVPAAGSGEVVFSGAQGGYGNTVVIEHSGGVRTRYAHLASIQVETGSQVEAGAVIGRVGSSGRSTGPHLHFEVLQDGHPVNPEVAATRYAGLLKFGGVVADLPGNQPSVLGVAVGVDDEDPGE